MCNELNCNVSPSLNIEGQPKALYCSKHKKDGMISVKHKTCLDCKKHPVFNVEGETKGLYCATHKKDGMVNVKDKTCIECKKQPSFNIEGETKAMYCATHKKDGMVNVITKTCIECEKRPSYNKEGESKALYCATHKKDGMIDVKHKTCLECKKIPSFNIEGKKALYCATHKKDGMIDVKHKTCLECNVGPMYNKEGETKGLYCSKHKKDGMVDVVNKTCLTYLCSTRVQEKYYGYCLICYMNLFPDKPVARNYKTKEFSVVEYVKNKFPNFTWFADKIVNGGCSKKRPDLLLDLGYQILIIEVDENQHTDYDCSCENKRIMELSQDLGHRPIIFIRFNPDDYEKKGINITSCWGHNKNGICLVKKSKTREWEQRLSALEENINYWINPENTTNKTIETIQLYYDM
jgi:ferredoxin-like protein FixX